MHGLARWALAALGAGAGAALGTASPAAQTLSLHVAVQGASASPTAFVRVVQDGESCASSASEVAMCASRDFVCRMEVGQEMFARAPSCLLYEPERMRDDPFAEEASSAAPWDFCDPQTAAAEPVCQRGFACQCWETSAACQCVPPDIVPDDERAAERGDGALVCGDSVADCADGEYCKFTATGERQCGQKPYYS